MIYSVDFEELSGKINYVNMSKYLHDLGWSEITSKRQMVKVFQLENEEGFFQIDLPISRELRDYKYAMFNSIQSIAKSTRKNVEQIILELLNPLSDIIRLRINEPDTEVGSIFVEDAISLYDNAKKLLMATAMDITRPQLLHVGRPENNIIDFVNTCRFGQTEIGSYVVSIVCPISIIDNNHFVQMSLFSEESECAYSLTRKVINKLIISVQKVKNAIDNGTIERVINENAETEDCISVNFLDALSGINIFRRSSTLDITAKYAPTIKSNTLPETSVSINNDYYTPINTIVKRVKSIHEKEKPYIGRIKLLDAVPDPSVRKTGKINIVFLDEQQNKATASVILSKNDYDAAINAHREGKNVKVVGTMSGQANRKKIDCSYFEVLE